MIIAIDGPAASGKSTTARRVAQKLGIHYLDTGAMYRAVTLALIREGVDLNNVNEVTDCLSTIDISFRFEDSKTRILLGNEDVSEIIRGTDVTQSVSIVSALLPVREKMVTLQRKIASEGDTIVEGRDIGTVVFPQADFKFFIVADYETRAKRRMTDLKQLGIDQSMKVIIKDLKRRDGIDSSRNYSPLKKAEDAIEIDTTRLTIEEQVSIIIEIIKKGGK